MPYFKDSQNNLHWLDEGVNPSSIPTFPNEAVEIADEEARDLLASSPSQILQAQIADIDAQLKAIDDEHYRSRGTREMDLQVAIYFAGLQGVTEPQLYAASNEYKRVKDAELITAKALRVQRKILDDQLDALS